MNDLQDLRDALRSDYDPRPLDLPGVLTAGGRLRRRRRAAVGAVSGTAVLALLVGGNQLVQTRSTPDPGGFAAAPAASAPATRPSLSPSASPSAPEPDNTPYGKVIDTGRAAKKGTWVLYAVKSAMPELPGTTFGIMLGRRLPGGELTADVVINEMDGPDRSAGFHTGEAPMEIDGGTTPAFGYFVGPADTITVKADGRTVTAEHRAWSVDPSVRIFWLPERVGPGARLSGLRAVDRNGDKLPAGNGGFAVG